MSKINDCVVRAIVELLNSYKSLQTEQEKSSVHYLLGQLVRTYRIADDHVHISKSAKATWEKITSDDISDKWFHQTVKCDWVTTPISLSFFTGSMKSGESRVVHKNDTFQFNKVFHVDHVTPVSLILSDLKNLNQIDETSVAEILNKMHICRILKTEDRRLGRTKERSLNYEEVIEKIYNPNNVEIFE